LRINNVDPGEALFGINGGNVFGHEYIIAQVM
jgi:hypothetical protein